MKAHTDISDEKDSQVIDGKTGDHAPHRRIDLSNLRDVRIEMAKVYRAVDAGEIKSQDGSRRVFILGRIADVIEVESFERRILELEARQRALAGQGALPVRARMLPSQVG